MKFALIFLTALVAISHQQFQRPRGVLWLSPYPNQLAVNNYQEYQPQPIYYNYVEDSPSFRYYKPVTPVMYSEGEEIVSSLIPSETQSEPQGVLPDVQSRFKPSFLQNQADKARFFFGASSSLTNALFKTATFTVTSTVSLTSIQSCIPAAQFAAGLSNSICRRKRNNVPLLNQEENIQFSITPSETLKVIPTELPLVKRENHQLETSEVSHQEILSSIDDGSQDQVAKSVAPEYLRNKRFYFNYFVTSTTLTTYSFVSTTVTKTINLLLAANPNLLQCRPSGFVVCA